MGLTELGLQQSQDVAAQMMVRPDRLVVSPFLRAQAMAAEIEERWLGLRREVLPIQELTYLSPARCNGTTHETRQVMVRSYWERCDPDYKDGEDAESFTAFMARLHSFHEELQREDVPFFVAVGHGQFFSAYLFALNNSFIASPEQMKAYRLAETANPLRNGEILRLASGRLVGER